MTRHCHAGGFVRLRGASLSRLVRESAAGWCENPFSHRVPRVACLPVPTGGSAEGGPVPPLAGAHGTQDGNPAESGGRDRNLVPACDTATPADSFACAERV